MFMAVGSLHLFQPANFMKIVPPALPDPGLLVAVSGVAEIAGGLGLLVPVTRTAAAYGLIALLIAVFPANVYMAIAHEQFVSFAPLWLLIARLPIQFFLIAWMWGMRRTAPSPSGTADNCR